jgi:hypothetical protein
MLYRVGFYLTLIVLLGAWWLRPLSVYGRSHCTAEYRGVLEATVAAWTKYQGKPPMECLQEAIHTPIAIVSVDKMQEVCSKSADSVVPIGCYAMHGFDRVILLRQDILLQPYLLRTTLGHEYIHVLDICYGYWEGGHGRYRLWDEYGANTVEADIRRRLR